MRFLSIGTGVIGTTYAWQLARAGHDVTLLVRPGRKEMLQASGIPFTCTDGRHGRRLVQDVFRPQLTEVLSPENDYDFILASPRTDQLEAVLRMLGESGGGAHIVLFSNLWFEPEYIEQYLAPDRYLFGFSFNVGGGRHGVAIDCTIFGNPLAATMIGEKDGRRTDRLAALHQALRDAGMNPRIQTSILAWLWTHYSEMACFIGGICQAGSAQGFAADPEIIRECLLAIRETRTVCRLRGVKPRPSVPLVGLPVALTVPVARWIFRQESFLRLIDGYRTTTSSEMHRIYHDVLSTGRELGADLSHYARFQPHVDRYTRACRMALCS